MVEWTGVRVMAMCEQDKCNLFFKAKEEWKIWSSETRYEIIGLWEILRYMMGFENGEVEVASSLFRA